MGWSEEGRTFYFLSAGDRPFTLSDTISTFVCQSGLFFTTNLLDTWNFNRTSSLETSD